MFETARPFLLALAIGLLIGLERERAQADHPVSDPLGSRTFTLLALLGAVAAHLEEAAPALTLALAIFAGAIILAGYFRSKLGPEAEGVGVTTEVAGMATFALGYLARREMTLSIMLAVITLAVLALKPRIHEFARAGLRQAEVSAALAFLVISFVVLPLLPDRYVDPWQVLNPARLWLLLVLISGMSFAGYIAVRMLGPERGLALAGLSGGLVSSTAAALALAQKSRSAGGLEGAAATGIVLATVSSAAVQLVVVGVIYPGMVPDAVPVIGAIVAVGAIGTVGALRVIGHTPASADFSFENPLSLRASAMLALALAGVLFVSSAAAHWLGAAGVLAVSALAGAGNVHGVSLAVANLAGTGTIPHREAVLAILVGFIANTFVKLAASGWVGGRRLALLVAPPMLAMIAAGVAAYALTIGHR
jgi:uncharacterized membrane protein (DUF4010 family)